MNTMSLNDIAVSEHAKLVNEQAAHAADRTYLDELLAAAHLMHDARDAIEVCCSAEWLAAHKACRALYLAVRQERSRLWKAAPWGSWMNENDKALATISGSL